MRDRNHKARTFLWFLQAKSGQNRDVEIFQAKRPEKRPWGIFAPVATHGKILSALLYYLSFRVFFFENN